jgi:hypothetical protein
MPVLVLRLFAKVRVDVTMFPAVVMMMGMSMNGKPSGD